ncbi:MAG: hypothetical protein AAGF58_01500 [Pseudomonadota bacterium]
MPTPALDISTVSFTPGDDLVIVDDVANITTSLYDAIYASWRPGTRVIDTLDGDDLIRGELTGVIDPVLSGRGATASGISFIYFDRLRMGEGDDQIIGSATVTSLVPDRVTVRGITNFEGYALLDMGDGRASILADANGTGRWLNVQGITYMFMRAGDDDAELQASAVATASADDATLRSVGVDISRFFPGAGDYVFNTAGLATLLDGGTAIAMGANNFEVETGSGDDKIEARGDVSGGLQTTATSIGFGGGGVLRTGEGNDSVVASGRAVLGDDAIADTVVGLQTPTYSGAGEDAVTGRASVEAGDGAMALQIGGIFSGSVIVDMGSAADRLAGLVDVSLGDRATVQTVTGTGFTRVETGTGEDLVTGEVSVSVGVDSLVKGVAGLRGIPSLGVVGTTLDTGGDLVGDDNVAGSVEVAAGAGSVVDSIFGILLNGGTIDTGEGNNRIEGTVNISGSSIVYADSAGIIDGILDTGSGNDDVIAQGAAFAVGGGDSVGIENVEIYLGEGADFVMARGATLGVRDAFIFGEQDDDLFDLHSGTGTVDGGTGEDELRLAGNHDAFDFNEIGSNSGIITDLATLGGVTDLTVDNIERFLFDDGSYDFGDLF